jgi:hypothetical protein
MKTCSLYAVRVLIMLDVRIAEGKDVILAKLKRRTDIRVWASLALFWLYCLHED